MTTAEKRSGRRVYGSGEVIRGGAKHHQCAAQKRIERAAKRGSRAEEIAFEQTTSMETPASDEVKREVDAEPPACHRPCCGGLDP